MSLCPPQQINERNNIKNYFVSTVEYFKHGNKKNSSTKSDLMKSLSKLKNLNLYQNISPYDSNRNKSPNTVAKTSESIETTPNRTPMELVLSSVKNEYASIGSGSIIEVKTDNKNERNSYIPPSIKDSVNRKLKQIGFKSHTNVFKCGFGKYSIPNYK